MPIFPAWVIVAFAAEVLWVAGNLIDKYLIEKYFATDDGEEGGVGTLIIFSGLFGFVIALFAYLASAGEINVSMNIVSFGLAVGVLNGLWVWLYLQALERTELSRVVPLLQTVPIFGLLFALVMLGEVLTSTQIIAAVIILAGAVLLSIRLKSSGTKFDYLSFFLMLGAAAIVAFTDVLFKTITLFSDFWSTAFWMGLGIALFGLFLYTCIGGYRRQFNKYIQEKNYGVWSGNIINEVVDAGANLTFAAATILGPVALVQTANAYQPFLILVASLTLSKLAPKYFSEETDGVTLTQKLIGIGIITVGSYLMYLTL